jgi:hypothetical protein
MGRHGWNQMYLSLLPMPISNIAKTLVIDRLQASIAQDFLNFVPQYNVPTEEGNVMMKITRGKPAANKNVSNQLQ